MFGVDEFSVEFFDRGSISIYLSALWLIIKNFDSFFIDCERERAYQLTY